MLRLFCTISLVAGMLFVGLPAWAGAMDGIEALQRGDYEDAIKHLMPAAQNGDPLAQYHLGEAFEYGYGVAPNISLAVRWYAEAAGRGHVEANVRLGKMNMIGQGLTRDAGRASEFFSFAARKNHPEAAYLLAVFYLEGIGVPKSSEQGLELLKHAANLEHPAALNHLGSFYATGQGGVIQNRGRAFELFHLAAARGNGDAMFNLGRAYLNGDGLPQDPRQAYLWLGLAGGYGNIDIQTAAASLRRQASHGVPLAERKVIDARIRSWRPLQ